MLFSQPTLANHQGDTANIRKPNCTDQMRCLILRMLLNQQMNGAAPQVPLIPEAELCHGAHRALRQSCSTGPTVPRGGAAPYYILASDIQLHHGTQQLRKTGPIEPRTYSASTCSCVTGPIPPRKCIRAEMVWLSGIREAGDFACFLRKCAFQLRYQEP